MRRDPGGQAGGQVAVVGGERAQCAGRGGQVAGEAECLAVHLLDRRCHQLEWCRGDEVDHAGVVGAPQHRVALLGHQPQRLGEVACIGGGARGAVREAGRLQPRHHSTRGRCARGGQAPGERRDRVQQPLPADPGQAHHDPEGLEAGGRQS